MLGTRPRAACGKAYAVHRVVPLTLHDEDVEASTRPGPTRRAVLGWPPSLPAFTTSTSSRVLPPRWLPNPRCGSPSQACPRPVGQGPAFRISPFSSIASLCPRRAQEKPTAARERKDPVLPEQSGRPAAGENLVFQMR